MEDAPAVSERPEMDRWLLARLEEKLQAVGADIQRVGGE